MPGIRSTSVVATAAMHLDADRRRLFTESNLSATQWTVWLGQQLAPDAPLYNMALVFEIDSDIDSDVFRAAFQELVKQSECLRTVFAVDQETPCQVIQDAVSCDIPCLDFRERSAADIEQWVDERTRSTLNLEERVFDSALLHCAEGQYSWYLNIHHIVTDAASFEILFRRMASIYGELRTGGSVSRSASDSYLEYVKLERAANQADRQLADRSAARSRISLYGRTSNRHCSDTEVAELPLGAELNAALHERALQYDPAALTPAMSHMKAWATILFAFLYRSSANRNLTIALPLHNRARKQFQSTSGLFLEMLPLSVVIEETETFQTLLGKVSREVTSGLLGDGALKTGGHSSEVLLNIVRAGFPDFDGHPVRARWIHPGCSDPQHVLRLNIYGFGGASATDLRLEMNSEAFGDYGVKAGPLQLKCLLDAFIENPTQAIDHIELVCTERPVASPVARPDVLPRSLVSAFEDRVTQSPDSVAVGCGDVSLSRTELNARANQLAHYLHQQGISCGARVAVMLERSVDMIVAMLGVMKAGACYVPIAPDYPLRRIRFMLDDADCRIALTQNDRSDLPVPAVRASWTDGRPAWSSETCQNLDMVVEPADPAYVIYTSGTTGVPKGVIVEHRNVVALVDALHQRIYQRYAGNLTIGLLAPAVFDASVQQIYVALLDGHRLQIATDAARRDGRELLAFFRDFGVDVVDGTPAHLRMLVAAGADPSAQLPRHLVIGGEQLTTATVSAFYERFHCRPVITNVYGVAECCVDSTAFDVTASCVGELDDVVPIGRPLPGSDVLVVNDAGRRQPAGLDGEVMIAGEGVSRGYLNRDQLTAERFVHHPDDAGKLAYLTGDIARYRPDGNIEFVGRKDRQVNLHGHRIELAEVEGQLLEYGSGESRIGDGLDALNPGATVQRCTKCLLTDRHPDVTFGPDGTCNVCQEFRRYRSAADAWFGTPSDFARLREVSNHADRRSDYDCLLLYSGGKDSSYVLYRLVELGLKVLAFTFDNGFISGAAFRNIRRQTSRLGVDLVVEKADRMNDIFVESLKDDHTVCSGCFRALTTISTRLACDRGINMIVTGLSRGQVFDTKLFGQMREGILETDVIEENLVVFRRLFHANNDRTSQLLNVDLSDVSFEDIHFVDFFRYDDTPVSAIRDYLQERDEYWRQPEDTGFCSSNCRMNDVGICVHQQELGYHNYEAPLSWDIRLGISTRAETLPEVEQPVRQRPVLKILNDIGYLRSDISAARVLLCDAASDHPYLAAFYASPVKLEFEQLREHLANVLPPYMIPSRFVRVDAMPLTDNGKIDDAALHRIDTEPQAETPFRSARTEVERNLVEVYKAVLRIDDIGIEDSYFELGGDSIAAIQIAVAAGRKGLRLRPGDIFQCPTISQLAMKLEAANTIEAGAVTESMLTGASASRESGVITGDQLEKLSALLHKADGEGRS